jgi:ribosomal protein S18 acetylase RimI-like enzyme
MKGVSNRIATKDDYPSIVKIDHDYHTDYVWQMDLQTNETKIDVALRKIKLPRSMLVGYPRENQGLGEFWPDRGEIFVSEDTNGIIGYIRLTIGVNPSITWISDLVILRRLRRHGIGTALVSIAQNWGSNNACRRLAMGIQSKNFPAICLAYKLGFEYCGYHDRYFANRDIALLFDKWI